jgi:hypothetical protein
VGGRRDLESVHPTRSSSRRPAAARCLTSTRAVPRRRATRRIASSAVRPDTPRNARPDRSTASSGTREASGLRRIERAGGRAGCAALGFRIQWRRKKGTASGTSIPSSPTGPSDR